VIILVNVLVAVRLVSIKRSVIKNAPTAKTRSVTRLVNAKMAVKAYSKEINVM
jgi:hypothetical protein